MASDGGGRPAGKLAQHALIAAGTVFLVLGVVGVFVPVLPTTPFLLLAAACYLHSSRRLHDWLIHSRLLGPYLRHYTMVRGFPCA